MITNQHIARVCHEVNRAYCQSIGDDSQPSWEDAPDWQKDSAIKGVIFHLHNPDAGPDHSHNEWLKEKEETGWKYGPVKDPEKKEHPCFIPYEELSTEQKAKDYIFRSIVHAMRVMREEIYLNRKPALNTEGKYVRSEDFDKGYKPE